MVRSIRLLAAAALAAGLAASTPAAHAQTGPQDEGAVQTTGPLGATPHEGKTAPDGAQKRARSLRLRPAGRSPCTPVRPT